MQTWKWKSNAISTQRRCLPWWCCIPYSSQVQHCNGSEENYATPMKGRSCFVSFCCIYTSPKCMLISTDGKAHVRPHSVANFNRDSLCSITNSLANFSQVCPWHVLAIDVHTCGTFTYLICNNELAGNSIKHQQVNQQITTVDTISCKRNTHQSSKRNISSHPSGEASSNLFSTDIHLFDRPGAYHHMCFVGANDDFDWTTFQLFLCGVMGSFGKNKSKDRPWKHKVWGLLDLVDN